MNQTLYSNFLMARLLTEWTAVQLFHQVLCFLKIVCENLTVSQEAKKKRKQKQRRIPTNDELLYDPEEDKRDQEWVDRQRRR